MSEVRVYDANNTALTVREEQVPSLLTGTPADRVTQASAIADALAPVIDRQKLYVGIGGKRHVLYEGWVTLGMLCGVVPVTAWTKQTERGWEARVEARTLAGAIVGAAESECSREEKRWKDADDYAIRSMAQTRAGSKALRMPLGFIMALAGFEATPAEEVTEEMRQRKDAPPAHAGDAPNCQGCNKVMVWRTGVKNGRKWQAWMCPDYRNTKHMSVFVHVKEEVPERDVDAGA